MERPGHTLARFLADLDVDGIGPRAIFGDDQEGLLLCFTRNVCWVKQPGLENERPAAEDLRFACSVQGNRKQRPRAVVVRRGRGGRRRGRLWFVRLNDDEDDQTDKQYSGASAWQEYPPTLQE